MWLVKNIVFRQFDAKRRNKHNISRHKRKKKAFANLNG